MVNFRFHLVSLIAVFLALGVGIIVGSTVIDQATVQGLERNVKSLTGQRSDARQQRDEARQALSRWQKFAGELPAELLAGRLTDVPVLLVAVEGVDPDVANTLQGAPSVQGFVVFQRFRNGVDKARYKLRARVDLADGRRLVLSLTIPVRAA